MFARRRSTRLVMCRRAQLAPLKKQERQLEQEIESLQLKLDSLEQSLTDERIYEAENKTELTSLLQQQGELKAELLKKEDAWLQLQE